VKKKMMMIEVFWTVLVLILCLPQGTYADYPDMDLQATPNPVGSGARAMGMGGAFIGVADDATAASWNPAGLLQLRHPEISIAGSLFSGKNYYNTSYGEGEITDRSPDIFHVNYASWAVPFVLYNRNLIFSLNYQHLYEFSLDVATAWREPAGGSTKDIVHKDHKRQRGALCTISPAFAFQIQRFLYLGLAFNFWDDQILDNGWENIHIQYAEGMGIRDEPIITRSQIYERYDFSGFNMNLGFLLRSDYFRLFGKKRQIQFGGVLKTPFQADIQHEKQEKFYTRFPEDPALNKYYDRISRNDLALKMPLSYGFGICFNFSESLALSLDLYRTYWDKYVLVYGKSGKEWSPVNKRLKEHANITPTTQVRGGAEYVIQNPRQDIHLRFGTFYDPEPAGGRPDNIYGISCGSGITYRGKAKKELYALDFMYQYRFGERHDAEYMQGKSILSNVKEHYFYISMIYYLF